MSTFGKVANAIVNSVGKTQGEMLLDMVRVAYPSDHPEVLFAEWLSENHSRLQGACIDLGIEPPEPGKGLYGRLKEVVMPILKVRGKDGAG